MKRLTDKRLALPPGVWQEVTRERRMELQAIPVPPVTGLYYRLATIEDILGDDYELDRLRELVEAEGVIDEGFTGSIAVKLYNHTPKEYYINKGDKISQLVILPVLRPTPVQVDKIEGGERGDNGFGSTGR